MKGIENLENLDIFNRKQENKKELRAFNQFIDPGEEERSGNNISYDIGPEILKGDKNMMIEQIENMKVELTIEDVDVSKFEINEDDSYEKIQNMWEKLKTKSKFRTYTNMFTDSVELCAEGVEWVFDGNTDYFGFKPNMQGWKDTVKVKLKRMRLETASFVSIVMQKYEISSGLSIFFSIGNVSCSIFSF